MKYITLIVCVIMSSVLSAQELPIQMDSVEPLETHTSPILRELLIQEINKNSKWKNLVKSNSRAWHRNHPGIEAFDPVKKVHGKSILEHFKTYHIIKWWGKNICMLKVKWCHLSVVLTSMKQRPTLTTIMAVKMENYQFICVTTLTQTRPNMICNRIAILMQRHTNN